MTPFSAIMSGVSVALAVYIVLIFVRIVLTWVSMDHSHPVFRLLHAVCDPYLNWFRRFRFMTVGGLDLSPVLAVVVLYFAMNIASGIGMEGKFSVGIVLELLLQLLWGAFSVLFLILGVLALVRFLAIQFRWGGQAVWSFLDTFLQPLAYGVGKLVRPRTFLSYTTTLIITGVFSLVIYVGGTFLTRFVGELLRNLPF